MDYIVQSDEPERFFWYLFGYLALDAFFALFGVFLLVVGIAKGWGRTAKKSG